MILVPHEDDEINLAGGVIEEYLKHGSEVYVVFSTNGDGDERFETGLRKMGAILGNSVEIGCNSVLNPGTVIGPGSRVYPLSSVRGVIPPRHIYKNSGEIVKMR